MVRDWQTRLLVKEVADRLGVLKAQHAQEVADRPEGANQPDESVRQREAPARAADSPQERASTTARDSRSAKGAENG